MKSLFEHSSFYWVRYDRYDLRRDAHSILYITPTANAKPEIYNPLKVAEQITLDALKVGMKCMNRQPTAQKHEAVTGFVHIVNDLIFRLNPFAMPLIGQLAG